MIALRFANRDGQSDNGRRTANFPGGRLDERGRSAVTDLDEDGDGIPALSALQFAKTVSADTSASRHSDDLLTLRESWGIVLLIASLFF